MKPKPQFSGVQEDLFRAQLGQIINLRHELVRLAHAIDWTYLASQVSSFYANTGRPALPARLIIGLHLLKYMYHLSDEGVCERWVHDPYFQYFCGEQFFQHRFPLERSSLTHFRKRVGEGFCTTLFQASLQTAHQLGALKAKQVKRVVVDTTVQPKAITFPTDTKLRYKAITQLGKLAKAHGIQLRQSYERVGKKQVIASARYRHAKQLKRAKKAEKKLKTYLGRVIRDVERQLEKQSELTSYFTVALEKATRIHTQQTQDTDKIYAWHAPEVECIGKGKAHKPYEFGCKVSITTSVHRAPAGHFVLHAAALPGKPYDGHTLNPVLASLSAQTGITPERVYVDKGYRGHKHPKKYRVFLSGQKRGVTKAIRKELRRRSVVEPLIGHLKQEGHLGRNYLSGKEGDAMNVLGVSAGYNFKLILRWLRIFWAWLQDRFFFTQRVLLT